MADIFGPSSEDDDDDDFDVGKRLDVFKDKGIALRAHVADLESSDGENDVEEPPKKVVHKKAKVVDDFLDDSDSDEQAPVQFVSRREKRKLLQAQVQQELRTTSSPAKKKPYTGANDVLELHEQKLVPRNKASQKKKSSSSSGSNKLTKAQELQEKRERGRKLRMAMSNNVVCGKDEMGRERPFFLSPIFVGDECRLALGPMVDENVLDTVSRKGDKRRVIERSDIEEEEEEGEEINKDTTADCYLKKNQSMSLVRLCLEHIANDDGLHDSFKEHFAYDEFKEVLSGIDKSVFIPRTINRYLRSYQREGVQFLYDTYCGRHLPRGYRDCKVTQRGCILADDMGLGKTIQTIGFIAAVLGKTGSVSDQLRLSTEAHRQEVKKKGSILLVVPTSVLTNWFEELNRWGYFSVDTVKGAGDLNRVIVNVVSGSVEVVLIGYDQLRSNMQKDPEFANVVWRAVIFDECHKLKNERSQVTQQATMIRSRCRIGLTGTPFQNRLMELWSVLSCLSPITFGDRNDFMKKFSTPFDKARKINATSDTIAEGKDVMKRLRSKLKSVILRRDKKTHLKDKLAGKEDTMVLCPLTELQKKVYLRALRSDDFVKILWAVSAKTKEELPPIQVDEGDDHVPANDPMLRTSTNAEVETTLPLWRLQHRRYLHDAEMQIQKTSKNNDEENYDDQGGSDGVIDSFAIGGDGNRKDLPTHVLCKRESSEDDTEDEEMTRPDGTVTRMFRECKMCPSCTLFPAIILLQQIANHLDLIRVDKKEKNRFKQRRALRRAKLLLKNDCMRVGESATSEDQYYQSTTFHQHMDDEQCGKMKVLKKLLSRWNKRSGVKVLVFSNSLIILNILEDYLSGNAMQLLRLDGTTPPEQRQQMCHKFNSDPEQFCFLISTTAGGVGLNLVGASKVVIFDPHWNPSWDSQAQDRAYRIGQLNHVSVYRLISQGTIEEAKFLRQVDRKQMAGTILDNTIEKRLLDGQEFHGLFELLQYSRRSFTMRINERYRKKRQKYMSKGKAPDQDSKWIKQFNKDDVDPDEDEYEIYKYDKTASKNENDDSENELDDAILNETVGWDTMVGNSVEEAQYELDTMITSK